MVRIDLLGAPGAGKSTLYEGMVETRWRNTREKQWITPKEAQVQVVRRRSVSSQSFREITYRVSTYLPVIRRFACKRVCAPISRRLFINNREEWEPFLTVCGDTVPTDQIVWHQRMCWLYEKAQEVNFLRECLHSEVVIWDESLLHKIITLGLCISQAYRMLDDMLSKMPLPDAVIHCTAKSEIVFQRMESRCSGSDASVVEVFRGRDEADRHRNARKGVELANEAAKIMRLVGVPVVTVDVTIPFSDQCYRVAQFIDNVIR